MMSTIAGEGTSSDGREVITTDLERERTGAEMTGTTGSGTGVENVVVVESTEIMTEVVGRDSPHPDTT